MAKSTNNQMSELMSMMGELAKVVKDIKADVDKLKDTKPVVKAPNMEAPKAYKSQNYKVLRYTTEYQDTNGDVKKDYVLPGMTFKSREAALNYIKKRPESKFDVIPL